MKGSVDLVRRRLDMEAVVAPEISATKVSILRYRITGPVDAPQINEVLRQPRKESQQ